MFLFSVQIQGGVMFERFNDRARAVIVTAEQEARKLGHEEIGTHHILLGILWVDANGNRSSAVKALGEFAIDADIVRETVRELVGLGQNIPSGHIPFSVATKKTFDLALRQAMNSQHTWIDPEHLLLGLIKEGEDTASQVLVRLGAELLLLRNTVLRRSEDLKPDYVGIAQSLYYVGRSAAALEVAGKALGIAEREVSAVRHLRDQIADTVALQGPSV